MKSVDCRPITTPDELAFFINLMQDSFPVDEYRDLTQIQSLSKNPNSGFSPYIIYYGEDMVGLISMWDFSNSNPPFVYYENFAMIPELRGSGIGTKILETITSTGRNIIIETELPTDPISIRRVKFYQRLGFKTMDIDYMQPAYTPEKKEVPLQIMYTGETPYQKQLDLIRIKVYKTQY